jgi:hypothetical protein
MSCSHSRRRTHCKGVVGPHKHTTRSRARENGPVQGHSRLLVRASFHSQPVRPRNRLRPKKETLRSYDFTTVLTPQLQDGATLSHTRMFSFWRVAFITIPWALLVTPVDRRLAAALLPASSAPRLLRPMSLGNRNSRTARPHRGAARQDDSQRSRWKRHGDRRRDPACIASQGI